MEVIIHLAPRDATVEDLIQKYARKELTFAELGREFHRRGWSTLSLYEVCRSMDAK